MVFSSVPFLCFFLPVVLLLYWILPWGQVRNGLLIVASLLFYAYGEPVYVLLMLLSIFINWMLGLLAGTTDHKRQWVVPAAVVFNIGLLFVFKYLDFAGQLIMQITGWKISLPQLPLPVGISFFTFQALSYVLDVSRQQLRPQKNLAWLTLYISFFPQLIAGPIVKYHDIAGQIEKRSLSMEQTATGFSRFIVGLAKKVLLANTLALAVDGWFGLAPGRLNILAAWLAGICYTLQIYFDFSGYSDMAIGLGELFGFHIQENFRYPYAAATIQEFWRRWHISLSTWFKEYLYIPLGGNRKGKARTYLNKWIVFLCTGLWHGANLTFLVWGMWHGLWIIAQQMFAFEKRLPRLVNHLLTMVIVIWGFVIFRADTLLQGVEIIWQMLAGWNFTPAAMGILLQYMDPYFMVCLLIALAGCLPYPAIQIWLHSHPGLHYSLCAGLLVLCLLNLSAGTYNPFIYFRF